MEHMNLDPNTKTKHETKKRAYSQRDISRPQNVGASIQSPNFEHNFKHPDTLVPYSYPTPTNI